jgi:hypothetical protein
MDLGGVFRAKRPHMIFLSGLLAKKGLGVKYNYTKKYILYK